MRTKTRDIHKGGTCVIVGNGPSLRLEDLEKLAKKYVIFGSNQIFRLPFTPTYYCIIDEDMMNACLPLPNSFGPKKMFIRAEADVPHNHFIYPLVANGFSLDINNFVVMGGTVTYALFQLAFEMGFSRYLTIGLDHHYPNAGKLRPGSSFVAGEHDPDHFECADGQPYFSSGKTFNAPEIEGTTRSYQIVKELFDKSGREVINISRQTKLDVFPRDVMENWI